jgi:hypothetical protein
MKLHVALSRALCLPVLFVVRDLWYCCCHLLQVITKPRPKAALTKELHLLCNDLKGGRGEGGLSEQGGRLQGLMEGF